MTVDLLVGNLFERRIGEKFSAKLDVEKLQNFYQLIQKAIFHYSVSK